MSSLVSKSRLFAVRAAILAAVATVITFVGSLLSPHWCAEETAATMTAIGSAWGLWPWLVARWKGYCVGDKPACSHSCKDHKFTSNH